MPRAYFENGPWSFIRPGKGGRGRRGEKKWLDRLTVRKEVMAWELLLIGWRRCRIMVISHYLGLIQVLWLRKPMRTAHIRDGGQISGWWLIRLNSSLLDVIRWRSIRWSRWCRLMGDSLMSRQQVATRECRATVTYIRLFFGVYSNLDDYISN